MYLLIALYLLICPLFAISPVETTFVGFTHEGRNIQIHLADSSIWQARSKDYNKLCNWSPGETVSIEARYRGKYKFSLFNHDSQEQMHVMLINYGESPKIVFEASKKYVLDSMLEVVKDEDGRVHYMYKNIYAIDVSISDGHIYTLTSNFDEFFYGNTIYIGRNYEKKDTYYFIITGIFEKTKTSWIYNKQDNISDLNIDDGNHNRVKDRCRSFIQ